MDNTFPKLNLEKFAHGYQLFYESIFQMMEDANNSGVLKYFLTEDIKSQYKYSNKIRNGYSLTHHLKETYLTGDKETLISFLNEMLPIIIKWVQTEDWKLDHININLKYFVNEFADILIKTNNQNVFNVDFYYDGKDHILKRKLDEITIKCINLNNDNLNGDNKKRYNDCVSEFISYKRDLNKENKLFYNESLDRLKRVIENTLQNKYKKQDGTFPMLHKKKEISNILFDDSNPEFESLVEYVIKNIHHENDGQPKIFTEKEYIYLWLELNKILYLLNRYSK